MGPRQGMPLPNYSKKRLNLIAYFYRVGFCAPDTLNLEDNDSFERN
jgi:hypothetical protein